MYLATRSIRSAGRSSGSVEITLPTQLQVLEGVECRLSVRDGTRPEIVLQPDISTAQVVFHTLWQRLALGLREVGDIGDFSPADFTLALFSPIHWEERPPLTYADALAVLAQRANPSSSQTEALSRLLTFLAVVAGHRLGLRSALALAFGDAVAYLLTDIAVGLGTDFERGMAFRLFWEGERRRPLSGSPFDEQIWQEARVALRRVYEQFRAWQEAPEAYVTARAQWYRGLAAEMHLRPENGPLNGAWSASGMTP